MLLTPYAAISEWLLDTRDMTSARRVIAEAPAAQTAKSGPIDWDAEEQAALLGLECTARVTCGRAEDGQASITGASLTLGGGDATARNRLREALALRYGLAPETIEMEESSP